VLQLLWIELVMKLAGGLLLVLVPLTTIAVLGLPRAETAFWPRQLGAALIGLSAATFMDASARLGHGLSLGGSFVINLATGGTLVAVLFLGQGPSTMRGRIVMWGLALATLGLTLVEIAYI
jgi:hypothetical protein